MEETKAGKELRSYLLSFCGFGRGEDDSGTKVHIKFTGVLNKSMLQHANNINTR